MKRTGILEQLRSDHKVVLEAVHDVERVVARHRTRLSAPMRAKLVEFASHLERQFATHLRAEDEVLYPALARKVSGGSSLVEPLHVEHGELVAMLESFQAALATRPSAFRDEQIVVQLRDLVDLLRIHIRKEEALLFGVAERLLAPEDLAEIESLRHGGKS